MSVNRLASKLVSRLIENPSLFGVSVGKTANGATIIDAGITANGGFEAGRLITEICMGGCGRAQILDRSYGNLTLPSIFVQTDHPVIATLGSQYAGWQINERDFFAIGSGPARALALKPKDIYEEIGYRDDFDKAVVVLETNERPPEKLLDRIVRDCKVKAENLAAILTPTISVAGTTQVAGRVVETGIHKLRKIGFDTNLVRYGWGVAPISPAHPKFTVAMARTNDAILYGGTAYLAVDCADEAELEKIMEKAPSLASKDYGKPFLQIFKEANYDFYKIDPNLFAPAVLIVNNLKTGRTLFGGKINAEALNSSFLGVG